MTDRQTTEAEPEFLRGITRMESRARDIILSGCSCDMICMTSDDGCGCGCLEDARSIIRLATGVES